jgi:hypothetical protein
MYLPFLHICPLCCRLKVVIIILKFESIEWFVNHKQTLWHYCIIAVLQYDSIAV